MFTPNLTILESVEETFTKVISETIRTSPRYNQWFTLGSDVKYCDPSDLYIECVKGEHQGNWNHHYVNVEDHPRDIVKKLIKFCPELYCMEYANLLKIKSY